uniref:Uncharacterized protein LOC114334722 n=1 Tax=Diabrotica virgifera virgifera TaxID=50390 RepID=A0A6P7G6X6_DIAVI
MNTIKLDIMEIKQETSEIQCKTEVCDDFNDGLLLDNIKMEIKEEPKIENTNDTFDCVDVKEYPIKTDTEQDEDKLGTSHEEQTKEDDDCPMTSFLKQLSQESSRSNAVGDWEPQETEILHSEVFSPTSGNRLLKDLDYPASLSDNYEPLSSDSETGNVTSESKSDHDKQNYSYQITEDTEQKETSKRKVKQEGTWKRNIRKAKRVKGESYTTYGGIVKPPRPLLPAPCLAKPKHKCKELVNEQDREKIYREFSGLSCSDEQRQFLCSHIEQNPKKRTTRNLEQSRKTFTCSYYFTVNGTKCVVCREFFMATLNVTDAFMRSSIKTRYSNGVLEKDRRGNHTPSNKLSEKAEQSIRNRLLGDLDYPASLSDNYAPLSSDSETDNGTSESNSDQNKQNCSYQIIEGPEQKETSKRKVKQEGTWKRNIRKAKRVKGESYTTYRGIVKPPRPLLPTPCLAKPKHKCKDLVNEQDREKIYREFSGLNCSDEQRQFLCSHIEQNPKKRTTRNLKQSRKTFTCSYYFTVNGTKCVVCREFFMATLNVTDAFMRSSIKTRSSSEVLEKERRGNHTPNKLSEKVEQSIRNRLLGDLDYPASLSDNYEPLSSDSETDNGTSESSSDHNKQNCSYQIIEGTEQKETSKRKVKQEGAWKRNIRKAKRVKGESYTTYGGIVKPPRPLLPAPCLAKPKHKCKELVNEQDREKIYREFRGLSCSDEQRQFLCSHIEQNPKKRTTRNIEQSRKTFTCSYYFTVNGTKCVVCREFFMATLNVTDAFMRSSIKNRSSNGVLEKDRPGKRTPSNKISEKVEQSIRDHILSFPSVEIHYCGEESRKKYLSASLNISIMYRLYKDICNSKNARLVGFEKYRQIFKEYDLEFFRPKKDQCKKC